MTPEQVTAELDSFVTKHSFQRPSRSIIDPSRPWMHDIPNYDTADLLYFRGRSVVHAEASLEYVVENAVKTWEMEASHLPFSDWRSVQHDEYCVVANGAKKYAGDEGPDVGNYNWLLAGVDKSLYDSEKETFESSHQLFRGAFLGGFPWEVLKVFSPPPTVAFSWRHWATFDGQYKGREGDGKTYQLYGFGVLELNDELKVKTIQVYYKPDEFLRAMQGDIDPEELVMGKSLIGSGCPFLGAVDKPKNTSSNTKASDADTK